MRTEPDENDLLAEVAKALRSGMATGFEQRVAANAVDLALRERQLRPASDAAEARRLQQLLGREGDPLELNIVLCEAIRAGRFATDDAALLVHLHASAEEAIAIDNPAYPAFANRKDR